MVKPLWDCSPCSEMPEKDFLSSYGIIVPKVICSRREMMMIKRTATVALLMAALVCLLPGQASAQDVEHFFRGRVLSVTGPSGYSQIPGNGQTIEVELISGSRRGEIVSVSYFYYPGDPMSGHYSAGQEVIVIGLEKGGSIEQFYLMEPARDRGVYYLIGLFFAFLLLIGRMQGLKTIITLAVTVVLIFKFLLPLLLQGYNPVLLAVIVACGSIIFTLLVIGGYNLKSVAAIIGTISGVAVAGLIALWAGSFASLTGFGTEEAQMLYFLNHTIDFRGLLFAGIIIGSIGAITDMGMSVASAAAEIRQANPRISFGGLTVSALNVGRDVMGTMTNTLILAYVGAAMPLLLLVLGHQIHWLKIINLDMIASEFVRGIAGSIGLVVAVPITAAVAGFLLTARRHGKPGEKPRRSPH